MWHMLIWKTVMTGSHEERFGKNVVQLPYFMVEETKSKKG